LGETIGETSEDYRDKVGAWFAEQPASAPFPAGTLLLYQDA
jgi:hypothetical protein